jgi:hypothetical protein
VKIEDDWDTRVTVPKHFRPDSTMIQNPNTRPQQPLDPLSPELNPRPVVPLTVPRPDKTDSISPVRETPEQPKKPEIIQCANIHVNQLIFINHTRQSIMISLSYQSTDTIIRLRPGRSYLGPEYISAEISSPPNQSIRFFLKPTKSSRILENTMSIEKISDNKTNYLINIFERRKNLKTRH